MVDTNNIGPSANMPNLALLYCHTCFHGLLLVNLFSRFPMYIGIKMDLCICVLSASKHHGMHVRCNQVTLNNLVTR